MANIYKITLPDGSTYDIIPEDNGTIQSGDVLTATVLVNPLTGNRNFSYSWQAPQSGGASKVKIYYVLNSGQSDWSGQDYQTYNFSGQTIYDENSTSGNYVATSSIYDDLSNGILVILRVLDPNGCPIYCFPSIVGDDASWMNFSATYTTSDDVLVTLNLFLDIGVNTACDGYYSLPSGGGGSDLPSVTSSDNGKFLRVVNGAWAAASVPNANGVSF